MRRLDTRSERRQSILSEIKEFAGLMGLLLLLIAIAWILAPAYVPVA